MNCITDPVAVFRILEETGHADFNSEKNHHSFFSYGNYFALLLYCRDGMFKGPRLYLIPKTMHNGIGELLIPELISLTSDPCFEEVKSGALAELRERMESRPASGFFLDAH